jgi:hypothetical protein
MTSSEQGRFCASCRKTVIDFSRMTDTEVVKRLSEVTGSICGRMSDSQLERDFVLYERSLFSVDLRAVLFGVALSFAVSTPAYTQGEVVLRTETVKTTGIPDSVTRPIEPAMIRAQVLNLRNEPLKDVEVILYDGNADTLAITRTDAEGWFSIDLSQYADPWSLLIWPNTSLYDPKGLRLQTLDARKENTIFIGNAGPQKQGGIVIQKREDNSWRQKNIQSKKQP